MGKLEGKVAVITGGSSGMALASAKRFVEEGAYVFITGRRQEALDEAVKLIGRNVTGVCGEQGGIALIRTHVAQRTEGQEYPGERAEPGADCHTDAGRSSHQGGEGDVRIPDPAGKDGSF